MRSICLSPATTARLYTLRVLGPPRKRWCLSPVSLAPGIVQHPWQENTPFQAERCSLQSCQKVLYVLLIWDVYLFDMEDQRMSQAISFLQCLLVLLSGLLVVSASGTVANPHNYGRFAQQEVSKDIPVAFITAKSVKKRLDKGVPQWLVDVRDRSSYDQSHLPDAVSLPLEELPQRFVEIPRDVPVVLY